MVIIIIIILTGAVTPVVAAHVALTAEEPSVVGGILGMKSGTYRAVDNALGTVITGSHRHRNHGQS
jgi:hypothetical protein